jgi:hypothetical protein
MLTVSHGILKILAAIVWYVGGVVLLLKGGSLLSEASELEPGRIWPWIAVGAGMFVGGLKALFIFRTACRKNLDRIARLEEPRIWEFFRPRFFVFLFLMMLAGATLSRLAHGNYAYLIAVGILDLTLATALLASSYLFWKRTDLT